MLKLLLAVAVLATAAIVLLARDEADAPLVGDDEPAAQRRSPERRESPSLERARCPDGVAGCRSVLGRIVYVEAVDPDGDGDLHVVIADAGITLPGLTAVDVRPGLRPRRDPRAGDRATAAGPVQTGSYGQSQIHALEFHARRG